MDNCDHIKKISYWFKKEPSIWDISITTLLISIQYNPEDSSYQTCMTDSNTIKSFNPKYNLYHALLVLKSKAIAVCNLQSNNSILKIISQVVIKCPEKIIEWQVSNKIINI